jgi:hypothetical protein
MEIEPQMVIHPDTNNANFKDHPKIHSTKIHLKVYLTKKTTKNFLKITQNQFNRQNTIFNRQFTQFPYANSWPLMFHKASEKQVNNSETAKAEENKHKNLLQFFAVWTFSLCFELLKNFRRKKDSLSKCEKEKQINNRLFNANLLH